MNIEQSLSNEFQGGEHTLLEAVEGARAFAVGGKGKHGSFRDTTNDENNNSGGGGTGNSSSTSTSTSYKAVVFDVGGVITESPFIALARYERSLPNNVKVSQ